MSELKDRVEAVLNDLADLSDYDLLDIIESQQARIIELEAALERLVFLHQCEQEGISSGMPTPKQWIDAVEVAEQALAV
jgi:hypothetical protein